MNYTGMSWFQFCQSLLICNLETWSNEFKPSLLINVYCHNTNHDISTAKLSWLLYVVCLEIVVTWKEFAITTEAFTWMFTLRKSLSVLYMNLDNKTKQKIAC